MGYLRRWLDRELSRGVRDRLEALASEIDDSSFAVGETEKHVTIETLSLMDRDPTIAAGLDVFVSGALPSFSLTEDKSPEGLSLGDRILDDWIGSPLVQFQTILRDGMKYGRSIAEIVRGPISDGYYGIYRLKPRDITSLTIDRDPHGNIEKITQSTGGGPIEAPLDRTIVFEFGADSEFAGGKPLLLPAVRPYRQKIIDLRAWALYLNRRTGIMLGKVKLGSDDGEKRKLLTILKRMTNYTVGVLEEGQTIEMLETSGTVGSLFSSAIGYHDKQIRIAILNSELATAEGLKTGSLAMAEEHGNVMRTRLVTVGLGFCEEVIREQVIRRAIGWNGYEYRPPTVIPGVPPGQDISKMIEDLSRAKRNELIPPEAWGIEAAYELLDKLGYGDIARKDRSAGEITTGAPEDEDLDDDEDIEPADGSFSRRSRPKIRYAAKHGGGKGRSIAETQKQGKDLQHRAEKASEEMAALWKELIPEISKSLVAGAFPKENLLPGGQINPTRIPAILDAVRTRIRSVASPKLSKLLIALAKDEVDAGVSSAEKVLKVSNAVAPAAIRALRISPQTLYAMLRADVTVRLGEEFADLTNRIYYTIRGSIIDGRTPREIVPMIDRILEQGAAFSTPSRAITIVLTELATAYNQGRMSVFRPLEDKFGRLPGSIVGYQYIAVNDSETREHCSERHGNQYRVDDADLPIPPLDYNCRGQVQPIFAGEEPIDPTTGEVGGDAFNRGSADPGIAEGFGGIR